MNKNSEDVKSYIDGYIMKTDTNTEPIVIGSANIGTHDTERIIREYENIAVVGGDTVENSPFDDVPNEFISLRNRILPKMEKLESELPKDGQKKHRNGGNNRKSWRKRKKNHKRGK